MANLTNKIALVTGGNSGIGKATAVAFARAGAKVAVAARRIYEGEETIRSIERVGGEGIFVRTDVADPEQVENMVHKVVDTFGGLDCVFNNAGVFRPATVTDCTKEDWDFVLSVNLTGIWLCMKYEIPTMLGCGGGAIVNMSSIFGLVGSDRASETATRHGVVGLTKAAALEYSKQGIRVNAVCPGEIQTSADQLIPEEVVALHPIGRGGQRSCPKVAVE